MSLNVSIGAKITAVKTVQSEIQKQLNNISKNLGITLNNVEFNLTKSSINSIQKQLNNYSNDLSVKISNIKISASALKQLKEQLSNQALNIKANVDTNSTEVNKQVQQTTQSAQKLKNDMRAINTQALDHIY